MDELEVLDAPKTQQKRLTRLLTPSGPEELTVVAMAGENAQDFINRAIAEDLRGYVALFNHGMKIEEPENFWIAEDDSLLIALVPQGGGGGGKSILTVVLAIAVVAFAAYAAPAMFAAMGGMAAGTVTAGGTIVTAGMVSAGTMAIQMGITMVGMMALNALIPPPSVNTNNGGSAGSGSTSSPTYSLGGQSNGARKYAPVAKIYGRHKVFPQLASNPLVANQGTQSSVSALYDFGLGDVRVTDLKIGDTLASTYSPELIWHYNSYVTNTTFLTRRVGYDQYSYALKSGSELIVRTKQATTAFDVDITFPRGLCYFDDQGNPTTHSVYLNAQYRLLGETTWRNVDAAAFKGINSWEQNDPPPIDPEIPPEQIFFSGKSWNGMPNKLFGDKAWTGDPNQRIGLSGATTSNFVAVVSIVPPDVGEFEFRIIKGSGDNTSTRVSEEMIVTMMKSYKDGSVVNLDKRHTMLEMRVNASDKLSGTVQTLNGIAQSILRTTQDGKTFITEATSNPAWIALDILTGEGNRKPLKDELIDWPSFLKFAKWCEDKKYYANFVVDYKTTVQELLSSVLSTGHAAMLFTTSGKYGILLDEERTTPRQLITPANSWGFKGNRSFADIPHGFLVTFINGEPSGVVTENAPEISWTKEERIVYNDGYDETNATNFETLETFGITNPDQAWRYGRYMLAQGIHRSESFSVTMDLENLAVQRGDLVHVSSDVAKIGGMPARVVSVDGNIVAVDQTLSIQPNGYSVRTADGEVRTGLITAAVPTDYTTVLTLDNAAGIEPDDLIIVGVTERVVGSYIVQGIMPSSDLSAELILVKYAPEVYQAETGEIPPWDAEISQDLIDSSTLYIATLTAKQSFTYVDRRPYAQIDLAWTVGGFGYSKADIYLSTPDNSRSVKYLGDSSSLNYQYLVDVLGNPALIGMPLTFLVVPLTAGGVEGRSASVTITLTKDSTPPEDIKDYTLNVQSETIQLSWTKSTDPDLSYYEIRYSPDVRAPEWKYSQPLAIAPWNSTTVSVGARTGTYFIRAVDTTGNASNIEQRRTTVVKLPNTEIVQDIDDRLILWPGDKTNFDVRAVARNKPMSEWYKLSDLGFMDEVGGGIGDLVSSGEWGSVASQSMYVYDEIIDFNDIYEVRISSKIQAHGEYESGEAAPTEKWDCWLEVRGTGTLNTISKWDTLAAQPDMIGTGGNEWSDWRRMMVGDVTSKLVQMRLIAVSYDPNVKVVVTDGSVIIDAMDRTWSKNNIELPLGISTIYMDPPFMFDDIAVAISIDGDEKPLTAKVYNKTRLSFDVELFDIMTAATSAGQVDVVVRGQGRERIESI
jgi:hypothetical protein